MNIWSQLPRGMRLFLLNQPLPESWKQQIDATLAPSDETAVASKIDTGHKRDYSMLAALIVLVFSAFILFAIAN